MDACTIEDGSLPGQIFPCLWDAQASGNGLGYSFVLDSAGGEPHYVVSIDADGSVITSDDAAAAQTTPQAEVSTAPPLTPSELAHTGIDGHGVLLAVALVAVGTVIKRLAKRGAM